MKIGGTLAGLKGLLRSPLMLNIIHHTYAGRAATELRQPGLSNKKRQSRIFDVYLRRMLDQTSRYSDQVTVNSLSWLAKKLTQRGEDVLYLDRLDESWVPEDKLPLVRMAPKYALQYTVLASSVGWLALTDVLGTIQLDAVVVIWTVAAAVFASIAAHRRISPAAPQAALGGMLVAPQMGGDSLDPWMPAGLLLMIAMWVMAGGKVAPP